jgi:hypothetical protein
LPTSNGGSSPAAFRPHRIQGPSYECIGRAVRQACTGSRSIRVTIARHPCGGNQGPRAAGPTQTARRHSEIASKLLIQFEPVSGGFSEKPLIEKANRSVLQTAASPLRHVAMRRKQVNCGRRLRNRRSPQRCTIGAVAILPPACGGGLASEAGQGWASVASTAWPVPATLAEDAIP